MDLLCYGRRSIIRVLLSGYFSILEQSVEGDHQYPHCDRIDRYDVSPADQGQVRRTERRIQRQEDPASFPGAELVDRSCSDVSFSYYIPEGLPSLYGRIDSDRTGPLHRHGDSME